MKSPQRSTLSHWLLRTPAVCLSTPASPQKSRQLPEYSYLWHTVGLKWPFVLWDTLQHSGAQPGACEPSHIYPGLLIPDISEGGSAWMRQLCVVYLGWTLPGPPRVQTQARGTCLWIFLFRVCFLREVQLLSMQAGCSSLTTCLQRKCFTRLFLS